MPMFTFRRKAVRQSFITLLRKRQVEFAQQQNIIAARIFVPPEISWWYFHEFGTAVGGRSRRVEPIGGASGATYAIYPKNADYLSWPGEDGSRVVRKFVKAHPGVPATRTVWRSLSDIRLIAAINLANALRDTKYGKLSPKAIRQWLLERTMPQAIRKIATEMGVSLKQTRQDGKLAGEQPQVVFERGAKIRDTSSEEGTGDSLREPFKPHPGIPKNPRPYDVVKNLPRNSLNRLERLALLSSSNYQEYQKSLKGRRLSEYFEKKYRKNPKKKWPNIVGGTAR